jgi:hypothetical protein
MNDSEFARLIRMEMERTRRRYASFFQCSDQNIEDTGAVESLMESMAMCSVQPLTALRSRGWNDPPDCEAITTSGMRVGIEVTEMVDQASIEADIVSGAHVDYAYWDADKLRSQIENRVRKKDTPAEVKGGPYDEYWLVIHCDEPAVRFEDARDWISGMPELRTILISRAFLLIGYSWAYQRCPYVELAIRHHARRLRLGADKSAAATENDKHAALREGVCSRRHLIF